MNNNQKSLLIALLITLLIFFVELIGGFISNSLALVSDAGHMLTDSMALGMALGAVFFAARPATTKRTFGFYRIEILAALLNGSLLFLVAFYIFYEAYLRFMHPAEVRSLLMLGIALIGLVANLVGAFFISHGSKENLNIRAAFLHVISDAVSSVGVIAGGVIIYFTHWYVVDPILGIMIGILILRGAYGLVKEASDILLESIPRGIKFEEVAEEIKKVKGIVGIHDLHIWTLTSGINAISAHLLIRDEMTDEAAKILDEVKRHLANKYDIKHCTFQTECESCPEGIICKMEPEEREEEHRH